MFCVAASYSVFYRLNPFIVGFRGTCVEQTSGVPKFSWGLCVGLWVLIKVSRSITSQTESLRVPFVAN